MRTNAFTLFKHILALAVLNKFESFTFKIEIPVTDERIEAASLLARANVNFKVIGNNVYILGAV